MEFNDFKELRDATEKLCMEHHGKSLIEVYPNEPLTFENMEEIHDSIERRLKTKKLNTKITNERIVEKPFIKSKTLDALKTGPLLNKQNKDKRIFIDYWREKWNNGIVDQAIPCDLYCLAFLSQVFKHITIYRGDKSEDIRLHVCLIMPSGTGKSEGNNMVCELAKMANLSYFQLDRFTDAILTGSNDTQAVERNLKHKLLPGMEGYTDPIKHSVLELNDIIIYDEGENILKSNPATEGAQRILQKTMNRHGSPGNTITNALVSGTIISNPNCSIFITSYYLKEFKETLLSRGLLQRMIVYIQEENDEQRHKITDKIIDEVPTFKDDICEAEEKQKALMARNVLVDASIQNELTRLMSFHENSNSIFIQEDVVKIIKDSIDSLGDTMPRLTYQREIWNSMVSRLTVNILKISAVFALMNYRTYISEWDARAATNLLMETMETVAFFLKKNIKKEITYIISGFYASLKNSKYNSVQNTPEEWENIIMEHANVTPIRAKEILKALIEYDKMRPISGLDGKLNLLRLL